MSASLHTHHTTPQPRPRASHDPVHYDKRPVFCHPPGLSLPGVPPVTPRACRCPLSCHTPRSVVSLLSPPGPSPPSVTSRQPLGLWWLSQQPWAHHCPMSCHPPGCHHPLSPPVTPQPVTTRCPLLSAASQGKTASGRCSGLCRMPRFCLHHRASKGRGHLSVFECVLVHLWKGQRSQ